MVVPQTNQQSFNATIRSEHPWLPITMQGVADDRAVGDIRRRRSAPQGDYSSPRGCRGIFGSFGTAEATRIEASFHGADCDTTFDGRVRSRRTEPSNASAQSGGGRPVPADRLRPRRLAVSS